MLTECDKIGDDLQQVGDGLVYDKSDDLPVIEIVDGTDLSPVELVEDNLLGS